METTVVIFRVDREGVVFALFPELPDDYHGFLLHLLPAGRPALRSGLLWLHCQQPTGNARRVRRSICRTAAKGLRDGNPATCLVRHARTSSSVGSGRLMSKRREEESK